MLRWVQETVRVILLVWISVRAMANVTNPVSYTLRRVRVTAVDAVEPMPIKGYPYFRLVRWLAPTTDVSVIYRQVTLKPGAVFTSEDLLHLKKRLTILPYFATVSVTTELVERDRESAVADIVIRTKDRFPIDASIDLEVGPLFTLTHNNIGGYGHRCTHQFFLKKRWGYGLDYERPTLRGSYLLGGQFYKQIHDTYSFDLKDIWVGKSFILPQAKEVGSAYWIISVSGCDKQFVKRPKLIGNKSYLDYKLVLCKLGWVVDSYKNSRYGLYTLHKLERLPNGGSIELLYGYQSGERNLNRHYVGISCIKNITHASCKYLHLAFAAATFVPHHTWDWEENILKATLAYAFPTLYTAKHCMAPFIRIDYIAGFRMPKEKRLAIAYRDPEALEEPDEADLSGIVKPIQSRCNVALESTLHKPIVCKFIRFAFLSFVDLIALYDWNNVLLNKTLVSGCGIGIRLEHAARKWPTAECKVAYSPLHHRMVPSVRLSICGFKNATVSKPMLMAYS